MARVAPLSPPKAHDVIRVLEPDGSPNPDDTYAALRRFYDPGGGPSLYADAKALVPAAFSRAVPLGQLIRACQSFRLSTARKPGEAVIRAAWGIGRDGAIVKDVGIAWPFNARPNLPLVVEADFILIEDGRPVVVWVQARRTHCATPRQFGLLYRLFLIAAQLQGQDDVGFRIMDMRDGTSDERIPRLYGPENLDIPTEARANELMQVFADAYDRLVAEGYQRPARTARPSKDQPDLFGSPPT